MTSRGLHDVLSDELKLLGLKVLGSEPAGVWFESSWEGCYKANLCLRSATRVTKPLLEFPAYQNDELYYNVKKHDFTKYVDPSAHMAVEAHVRDSSFRDSRFVALKVKDAVVDQFRDKLGERPSVDKERPDLKIIVRIIKNQVALSLDTSGSSLSLRGYRKSSGLAPLREHLAAGLLKMSGWEPGIPLVDPMCGSGTFLIEAAMMARRMAPGSLRKSFAFQKLKNFQKESWNRVVEEVMDQEIVDQGEPREGEENSSLYGFDLRKGSIQDSLSNAREAGVEADIYFKRTPITLLKNPLEDLGTDKKGFIIVNPPYGERIGTADEVMDLYKDLAFTLKTHFKGWTCWVVSGNSDLTKALNLKASRKYRIYNGPLECRFLKYQINS